jgi:hypothetical protein
MVLLVLWAIVPGADMAQAAVACRAEASRRSVARGEDVVLVVSAEGDIGWSPSFQLPDLPGVRIYGGGTNQSMTSVNGQSRIVVSRTFYLRVETDVDFTIGPVRVNTAAGPCQTDPIAIKVLAGSSVPPADSGNRQQRPAQPAPGQAAAGEDMFVTMSVDKPEAWVGQQIVLSFQWWRRIQPWGNPSYNAPRTEGFWREDLGTERNSRQMLKGIPYNMTEIRYALFPTRAGKLQIDPAELVFPEDVFDRFFNSRQQPRGPRVLKSRPVTVTVRDLPSPKPAGFSGIVGTQCAVDATVDRTTVPRGDAIGLKLALNTDGFLKGFAGLKVTEPDGTRLHDAAENFASTPQEERLLGRLNTEKVMVTTKEGTVHVPAVEVSWFDVTRGEYRVARTTGRDVVVTPSDRPVAGGEDSGFLRNEIARVGDDLAFIHVGALRGRGSLPRVGGAAWWLLALLPAALLGAWRWRLGRLAADKLNPGGRRRRGALGTAKALLAQVGSVGDGPEALSIVVRAVHGYVADNLDRPASAIGSDEIGALSAVRGCAPVGASLVDLLERCDHARFGGQAGAAASSLANEAASLLQSLDKASGANSGASGPGAHVATLILALVGSALVAGPTHAAGDARALVAQGNQAYTESRFAEARDLYLQARAQGTDDPTLHYNLGTAQARTGQVGPAVASFLRAERLAPRDRDVRRNLSWLRQNLKDLELADQSLPLFVAQAAAVVGALSIDEWGMLLVVGLWAFAAILGWRWMRGPSTAQRRAFLGAVVAVALLGAVTGGRWYQERVRDQAVVVVDAVDVRSGPASTFPTLFGVHAGLALNVEGQRDGWAKVSLGGDWQGWIPAESVEHVRLESAR